MWKTQLNRAIREVRFVLKQAPEHHGIWRYVETKLPELRVLNQNTFFGVAEIDESFPPDVNSAVYFVYGDDKDTEQEVLSSGVSIPEFEKILQDKVKFGLTLNRHPILNNHDRSLPYSIVESHKFVRHEDDNF
mmetsp:Transcript_35638/g.70876  ORF Transcript_35638/g.70876 Transcript_35638/m.70876 type:complete len:133 (-) Transcript_35638:111-509(-)